MNDILVAYFSDPYGDNAISTLITNTKLGDIVYLGMTKTRENGCEVLMKKAKKKIRSISIRNLF